MFWHGLPCSSESKNGGARLLSRLPSIAIYRGMTWPIRPALAYRRCEIVALAVIVTPISGCTAKMFVQMVQAPPIIKAR